MKTLDEELLKNQKEAVLLMQRTDECYEIVMERESKREAYSYHTEHNTYEWVKEVAQTLADIYKIPIVNLIDCKKKVKQRVGLGVN